MQYEDEDLPEYQDSPIYRDDGGRLSQVYHVRWMMRFNPTWTLFSIDVLVMDIHAWDTRSESNDSDWQMIGSGNLAIAMKITAGNDKIRE